MKPSKCVLKPEIIPSTHLNSFLLLVKPVCLHSLPVAPLVSSPSFGKWPERVLMDLTSISPDPKKSQAFRTRDISEMFWNLPKVSCTTLCFWSSLPPFPPTSLWQWLESHAPKFLYYPWGRNSLHFAHFLAFLHFLELQIPASKAFFLALDLKERKEKRQINLKTSIRLNWLFPISGAADQVTPKSSSFYPYPRGKRSQLGISYKDPRPEPQWRTLMLELISQHIWKKHLHMLVLKFAYALGTFF